MLKIEIPSSGGGGSSPAGLNTQIQYNNMGAFGASPNLIFDGTNVYLATAGAAYTQNNTLDDGSGNATFAGTVTLPALTSKSTIGTDSSGKIIAGSGGGIGGSIASEQVAYGSGVNTVAGSSIFTFDGYNLTVGGATYSDSFYSGNGQHVIDHYGNGSFNSLYSQYNTLDDGSGDVVLGNGNDYPDGLFTTNNVLGRLNSVVQIGDWNNDNNGTNIVISDYFGSIYFNASGGFYTSNSIFDNGHGQAGFGMTTPAYEVDIYDYNSTGVDIGNSTTGDWSINNNGSIYFDGGRIQSTGGGELEVNELETSFIESPSTLTLYGYGGVFTQLNTLDDGSGNATFVGTITPQKHATSGAPTYVEGAIYYDTTLHKLRVGGATGWETITSI